MPRPLNEPTLRLATTPLSPCRELSAADPKLGKLIERAGPFTLRVASAQSPFEALVEIHHLSAAPRQSRRHHPSPPARKLRTRRAHSATEHFAAQHLLDCPNEQLRAAGLSHNKMLALRDLAAKTLDGTVPTLAHIRRMSDEAIIEHLTQVRGIGRWTVEMLLIFRLGRPNVLPVDDYGVRKGFALTFGKLKPTDKVTPMDLPKPDDMHRRAKKWQPWCSVASWYLWRACDLAKPKA